MARHAQSMDGSFPGPAMLNHVGTANHLLSAYNFHGLLLTRPFEKVLFQVFWSFQKALKPETLRWEKLWAKVTFLFLDVHLDVCFFVWYPFAPIKSWVKVSLNRISNTISVVCSLCCTHKTSVSSGEYLSIASHQAAVKPTWNLKICESYGPNCF